MCLVSPSVRLSLTAILLAFCHFCGNGRILDGVEGLSAGELDAPVWILCGRAGVDAPPARVERSADVYLERGFI